eukprot:CAMPEP_0181332218 /NCGR_PEP_ID=MMETSP1101-20121128/24963_1 /TAXON_ID=46948 /ORGANISM="Rhodomonas abbreviata, Strain Caron Lab Isolate" /LENGTH=207 /DNA_ID=CAMNT_0023441821 /DNA_START=129 /DNA_END=754 /DNA_ORIENTATION=-
MRAVCAGGGAGVVEGGISERSSYEYQKEPPSSMLLWRRRAPREAMSQWAQGCSASEAKAKRLCIRQAASRGQRDRARRHTVQALESDCLLRIVELASPRCAREGSTAQEARSQKPRDEICCSGSRKSSPDCEVTSKSVSEGEKETSPHRQTRESRNHCSPASLLKQEMGKPCENRWKSVEMWKMELWGTCFTQSLLLKGATSWLKFL